MSSNFSFFESRAVHDIVEADRLQVIVWRMRIVCWISKATNARSDYVVIITLPLQQRLRERASMLQVMYIDSPMFIVFQHYR